MTMNEVDHISAALKLQCQNHHGLGILKKHRGQTAITYNGRPWALMIHEGFFSFPVCPGGCQYEVVEIPERLEAKLDELANNRDIDEETYTLRFLGPPRATGEQ